MSKNNMVPSIRFKEFTNAWEQERFENIYQKYSVKNNFRLDFNKYISIATNTYKNDFTNISKDTLGNYILFKKGYVAFEGHTNIQFPFGRFVMNTIGDGIVSNIFSVFKPVFAQDLYYWKYAINNNKVMLEALKKSSKSGIMMNTLDIEVLNQQIILFPNQKEQNLIGFIFVLLDSLITLHQRKLNALENLKKTLLEKMFPSENSVFPSIRFKEFTNAWEQERLGKYFKIYRNVIYINDNQFYKQITIRNTGNIEKRNVTQGIKIGRKRQFLIDLKTYPNTLTFIRQGVKDGGIGFVPDELNNAIVTENMPLFSISGCDINFLISLFRTFSYFKAAILNNPSTGSAQQAIHEKDWLISIIAFPNINEQKRIGIIFSLINSLIALHQRELKILKIFKKSLFVKMIVGKNLTILLATLTKMTNVWEQERLGKISNFSTGKGITISQSLSKGFPIVSGGIDVMGYYSKYNRMENTITIARAGKCGYVSFISEKFYLNDKCFSLDLKENINSYFLFNLLKKNEKRIMELGSNSSIPTITSTSLKAVDIFRTSYDEQKAIAILFVSINSLITLHQRKLNALENLKKTLLEKMFV
ncbi:restriction endonuclease subunit S [Mycoplasmopsis cynos]|uniref:Restriction endonuclease subunit S n=2 Tax=Mycoplasmopsis cynos TaxID=171284 RepID=A0ABD8AIF5_9BACT|nr:restriction endonuclease subunit S [Mycoplasmopsis cynos]MCU9935364.1 restriction endonuclease subunit S [Mycoplasmopsis cynos]WAM08823.1 restriction endonuclease subunit S [Mycoplasmopsis cynos]WQQ19806.1 restriction endonuclease subunit S [Mycoplasmopsis cynos]